jgi:predicted TIM-barrel fold metal-dependent hydrolase
MIYSCDDHLDIHSVPPDLWTSRLPTRLRDRGPRVEARDGQRVWVVEDTAFGVSGLRPNGPTSAIARAGLDDDGFRAGDPVRRLADMDRDGIDGSVIYGPFVVPPRIDDAELRVAVYAAWNDWAAEFNGRAPERLSVLARLPAHDAVAAAAELERCAALGLRGALFDVFAGDIRDPSWDRLWAAAAAARFPISFHLGEGFWLLQYSPTTWQAPATTAVSPLQLDEALATMVFSGALTRHPDLRIVLAEIGLDWLPYLLHRFDHEWGKYRGGRLDVELAEPPSELFRRQVFVTFEEEHPDAVARLGPGNCMWASDYPHADSTFPDSQAAIAHALGSLSDADRALVVGGNCARLYGFAGTG